MKYTIIDIPNMCESVCKDDRRHDYHIDHIQVYTHYLYLNRKYVGDSNFSSIEYHLFPEEHIGIYIRHLSERPTDALGKLHKFYVDMVDVEKKENQWIVKDLYIDFIIKQDDKAYVVDIDEFADAIQRDELLPSEIDGALRGLDTILKAYYQRWDVMSYIEFLKGKYMSDMDKMADYECL